MKKGEHALRIRLWHLNSVEPAITTKSVKVLPFRKSSTHFCKKKARFSFFDILFNVNCSRVTKVFIQVLITEFPIVQQLSKYLMYVKFDNCAYHFRCECEVEYTVPHFLMVKNENINTRKYQT